MKNKIGLISLVIVMFSIGLQAQFLDTIVDIGTQKMHFNIWKGTGTPILFESGGGNDGSIWNSLAEDIHLITGTTVIIYDRVGYGQSEFNSKLSDEKKALITNGINALENGLLKLGYNKELILVAHSYGGYYATYLASKNPLKIKGVVLIDAVTSCFHSYDFMKKQAAERTQEWLDNIKLQSEPLYYECLSNAETIEIMRNHSIPLNIPVIDLVADDPPFEDEEEDERWKFCHQDFVKASPKRKGIVASNCGHYLHFDNSKLAIDAIVSLFVESNTESNKSEILKRHLAYSLEHSNNYRREEYEYWHSERDLNRWGYSLVNEEKLQVALKILELNTLLYPESYNVWDSYGEVLLLLGDKERSAKMYRKSLELNPENENAKNRLKNIEG